MKRKPHNKPQYKNMDFSKPLDINIIGTENDPCFGKAHSLKADECKICGDSEICSIITAQTSLTRNRTEEHKKHKFKDLEEAQLLEKQEKIISTCIRKLSDKGEVKLSRVVKKVYKKFGYDIPSVRLIVKSYIARNKELYKYDKTTKTINIL